MRLPALARKTHKWLALIIGVQAVFWTLSGLYMTAVHIDIIHGDHLVRAAAPHPIAVAGLVEPASLLPGGTRSVKLENFSWVRSMAWMVSENTMQAAVSSENMGFMVAPTAS